MYRKLLGLAGAAALVIGATAGPVSAHPQGATPECLGNEASFYATTYGGLSNAAAAFGLTVPEGHNVLLSICGRTNGVVPIP